MPHATEWKRYSVVSEDGYMGREAMLTTDKRKRCRATGCDQDVARWPVDGVYWYSPYWCSDHICHVGPDRCANKKKYKDRYCSEHSYCAASGCSVEPKTKDLSRCPLPWFGPNRCCKHEDQHGERCVKASLPGSSHCDSHYARSIHKKRPEQDGIRCCVQKCTYQRSSGTRYCSLHKCAHCEALADGDGVCGRHRVSACSVLGCESPREVNVNNELGEFCSGHRRCSEHKNGCQSIVLTDQVYCGLHVCGVANCHMKRYQIVKPTNIYCQIHTCNEEACTSPTANVNDSCYQRCVYHTCGVPGCYKKAAVPNGYCRDHCCEVQDCDGKITDGHRYCTEHECKENGCVSLVKYTNGYCSESRHACSQKDCAARAGDIEYPELCVEHARQSLRQACIDEGRKVQAELDEQKWRAAAFQNRPKDYVFFSGSSTSGSSKDRRRRDKKESKVYDYEWERRHRREHSHERTSDSRSISSGHLSNGYRYYTITNKH